MGVGDAAGVDEGTDGVAWARQFRAIEQVRPEARDNKISRESIVLAQGDACIGTTLEGLRCPHHLAPD